MNPQLTDYVSRCFRDSLARRCRSYRRYTFTEVAMSDWINAIAIDTETSSTRLTREWLRRKDSNLQHPASKAGVLPVERHRNVIGGSGGTRTRTLPLKRRRLCLRVTDPRLVRAVGLEPTPTRLRGECSATRATRALVLMVRIERTSSPLQGDATPSQLHQDSFVHSSSSAISQYT